jgi:hypothetical protein
LTSQLPICAQLGCNSFKIRRAKLAKGHTVEDVRNVHFWKIGVVLNDDADFLKPTKPRALSRYVALSSGGERSKKDGRRTVIKLRPEEV